MYLEVKGQLWGVVIFLFLPCGSCDSNSGSQTWMPVPSPAKPLFWIPSLSFQWQDINNYSSYIKKGGGLSVIAWQRGGHTQVVLMPGPHDFALGGSGLLHGLPTTTSFVFHTSPLLTQFPVVHKCHSPPLTLSVQPSFCLLFLPLITQHF